MTFKIGDKVESVTGCHPHLKKVLKFITMLCVVFIVGMITDANEAVFSAERHDLSSGDQGAPDKNHTVQSDNSHNAGYYEYPERPRRHFRLSYKVFLGALVFICGLYYLTYTLRSIGSIDIGDTFLYFFVGVAGIGVGVTYMFAYGFSIIPS